MMRFLLFPLFVFCYSTTLLGQFTLQTEISGLRNNEGIIMFQLFDESENIIEQVKGEIIDKTCSLSISNIQPGKYAVRYFHDENLNGKMETNVFGKPTEGYGFSNNVTGKSGPPPFEKWLFEITEDLTIYLRPTY